MQPARFALMVAICGLASLLAGAGPSLASGWKFAAGQGSSTFTARTDIITDQGMGISIHYACTAGAGQRLDIVLPAGPFNTHFLGDNNVGVAWNWEAAPAAGQLPFRGKTAFYQARINRFSRIKDSKVVLSFSTTSTDILEGAHRLAHARQPVVLALFPLGRKGAIQQSDIVLRIEVPAKGAAQTLGKARALCGLSS